MQDLIQKAKKGSQEAMTALYNSNKSQILFLCRALLLDDNAADNAMVYVFKKSWGELVSGGISSEEEFTKLLLHKAAAHCKTKVGKKNSKAFRMPANFNFAACDYRMEKMNVDGGACSSILANLPELHRFIYVLRTVAEFSNEEIAKMFGMSMKMAESALEAEEANVRRIAELAGKKLGREMSMTAEEFHKMLLGEAASTTTLKSVDKTADLSIRDVCIPIQEAEKKKRIRIFSIAGAAVLVIGIVAIILVVWRTGEPAPKSETAESGTEEDISETAGEENGEETSETAGAADIEATHYAEIAIQDYGTITVALDGNTAPETVENFVSLAESGFYDGLTFHRIIEGFMMQGGDPKGDGTGGSDTTITGEFSDNGFENNLSHTRGAISMARSQDYNSASSQFFIVQEDSTYLDGQYAVFGYVTDGMDVVDAICESAEPTDDNGTIPADAQPVITSITVTEADDSSTADDGAADDSSTADDGSVAE